MSSPFETLGLLPSIVAKLDDAALERVIFETAKRLQTIFHPDKGGDSFMSVMINESVSLLSNRNEREDFRNEYLAQGPGQKQIKKAESDLLVLRHRIAALEKSIKKTETEAHAHKFEGESRIENMRYGEIFYEYGTGMVESDSIYSERDIISDKITYPAVRLRSAPGMRFSIRTLDTEMEIEALKQKLIELEKLDENKNQDESLEITRLQGAIEIDGYLYEVGIADEARIAQMRHEFFDDWKKTDSDKPDDEIESEFRDLVEESKRVSGDPYIVSQLEEKKKALETLVQAREKRKKEIKSLTCKIKEKEKELSQCHVDERYFLIMDGNNTGFRVVGCTSDLTLNSMFDENLFPYFIEGNLLVAVNEMGKVELPGIFFDCDKLRGLQEEHDERIERQMKEITSKGKAREPEPDPELSKETSLAKSDRIDVSYKKNPFEALGLLPSLVDELSAEKLRSVTSFLARVLMEVTHPDKGGNEHIFKTVSSATSVLTDPESFRELKEEYSKTQPGEARLLAIQSLIDEAKNGILPLIRRQTDAKIVLEKANQRREFVRKQAARFNKYLLQSLFQGKQSPKDDEKAIFLHHADGLKIQVSTPHGAQSFTIKKFGIDVFAVSGSGQNKLQIMGSSLANMFKSREEFEQAIKNEPYFYDCYLYFLPVLKQGEYLVAVDGKPKTVGRIEKIELAQALTEQSKTKEVAGLISRRIKIKDSKKDPSLKRRKILKF